MMNQEDLFKKLGLILNELNEQYQFLAQNPQQLNELELELFHANANFLADHVQIVKKITLNQPPQLTLAPTDDHVDEHMENHQYLKNDVQEEHQIEAVAFADEDECEPENEVIEEGKAFEVDKTEVENSFDTIEKEVFKLDNTPSSFEFILNDHSEHEKFEFEQKSVDEIFNRPLSEAEERILAEKKKLNESANNENLESEEDEIGPEPFLVYKKEADQEFAIHEDDLTLEEAPTENIRVNDVEPVEDPTFKPTLNDMLASQSGNLGSVNSTSAVGIKDLKQAINLNDKLLYIKDLFNGYNLAYAEAIDVANKLPNFEAADNFFQKNYAVKNNWASKQSTVDKFYQLLNQRFKL